MELNSIVMALDKSDLQAIDNIVAKRIGPLEKGQTNLEKRQFSLEQGQERFENGVSRLEKGQARLEKKINSIDSKFDRLFNFLDKDVSVMKEKIATRLGIKVSELSAQ